MWHMNTWPAPVNYILQSSYARVEGMLADVECLVEQQNEFSRLHVCRI
jgi:hypothetical protein